MVSHPPPPPLPAPAPSLSFLVIREQREMSEWRAFVLFVMMNNKID